jgi:long-subunit acyl-CoA synthetase (AMP-forming)
MKGTDPHRDSQIRCWPIELGGTGRRRVRWPSLDRLHHTGWARAADTVYAASGRIALQPTHSGRASHPETVDRQRSVTPSETRPSGIVHTATGNKPFVVSREPGCSEYALWFVISPHQLAVLAPPALKRRGDPGRERLPVKPIPGNDANQRTDAHGGPAQNRARLPSEVTREVAQAIDPDRLGLRISPGNPENDIRDHDQQAQPARADMARELASAHLQVQVPPGQPILSGLRRRGPDRLLLNRGLHTTTCEQAVEIVTGGIADAVTIGSAHLADLCAWDALCYKRLPDVVAVSDQRHSRGEQPTRSPSGVQVRSTEKTEGHIMTSGSLDDMEFLEIDGGEEQRLARRVRELFDCDGQFRAAIPFPEVIEAACAPGLRLTQVFETIVEGYTDRPALGQRARELVTDAATGRMSVHLLPRFETISYREVWDRVRAVAGAWRHDPVHPVTAGDVVATVGFSSADYVVVDMVCAYLGLVTVPLQHNAPVSRLRPIIEECEPRIVAVGVEYLDLAVESVLTSPSLCQLMVFDYQPEVDEQRETFESARVRLQETGAQVVVTTVDEVVERGSRLSAGPAYAEGSDERLAMIMYTSGSTGAPKGVMHTERTVAKVWTAGFFLAPGIPVFNVNFMPLNHIGGRLPLASAFVAGGTNYFVPESDLSTLFEDWALVRPTELGVVPRVVEMLYQHYRSAVDRRIAEGADTADAEQDAAIELRERVLGGRVLGGFVGTAPLAGEMKEFLDSTLGVHIFDGYGLTETGFVARDDVIARKWVLDYKLIDVPELGYFLTDRPYPRGELLVKTDMMTLGYYKRPELTAAVFDEDGFYRTGDVVAEIEPDRVVYVDRRNNVLKLAQGEFVAVANLEAVYAATPLVRQIFVYGNSERSSLLAVIVPTPEAVAEYGNSTALKAALHRSLQQSAAVAELQSYEVPVDFLIETAPFTDENGLLSGVGKLLRPRLKEHYGERLEQMYTEIATAQVNEIRVLR